MTDNTQMQAGDRVRVDPGWRIVAGAKCHPAAYTATVVELDDGDFAIAKRDDTGELCWIDGRLDDVTILEATE